MRAILTILFSVLSAFSFGQNFDFVKVLPGKGIVYNNDSILLNTTSLSDLYRKLNIEDTSEKNVFPITHWDGYDPETNEFISGEDYTKEINYKSITFNFSHENSLDSLELISIEIKEDKNLKVYTNNGFMIGMINPKLKEKLPLQNRNDYISDDELTYNLYTYGISFYLEIMPNGNKRITKIETHIKIK